jgi:hypothetical protein
MAMPALPHCSGLCVVPAQDLRARPRLLYRALAGAWVAVGCGPMREALLVLNPTALCTNHVSGLLVTWERRSLCGRRARVLRDQARAACRVLLGCASPWPARTAALPSSRREDAALLLAHACLGLAPTHHRGEHIRARDERVQPSAIQLSMHARPLLTAVRAAAPTCVDACCGATDPYIRELIVTLGWGSYHSPLAGALKLRAGLVA